MKKRFLFLLVFIFAIQLKSQVVCSGFFPDSSGLVSGSPEALNCQSLSVDYQSKYRLQQSFISNNTTATKTVKVAIHVWQDHSGGGNWQNTPADIQVLSSFIDIASNQFFGANDQPSDPISGVPFINDTKIRLNLEGIYFYPNTSYFQSSSGIGMNEFAIAQNPECRAFINIHMSANPTATHAYATFSRTGLSLEQNYLIWTGYHGDGAGTGSGAVGNGNWAVSQLLTHELGHILGLCHTSCCDPCTESIDPTNIDFLSDVFVGPPYSYHQGGWLLDPFSSSNTATNNIMGSTSGAGYFSPLQMGRIHRLLSLDKDRWRYASGYSEDPLEISQNEVWDFPIKLYQDLVIKSGSTLTVQCKIEFVKEAGVIIEPGAELILDGGHLTKTKYETEWKGVYLHGNSNGAQTALLQPKITLKNDAQISYAKDAITTIGIGENNEWIWGTTGGIIDARDSRFINNRKDVALLAYISPNAKNEKYQASFIRCEFIRNSLYPHSEMLPSISMWKVAGVDIEGCLFRNLNSGDKQYHGGGLKSIQASYRVHNAPSGENCQFQGYADALRSDDDLSVSFPITIVGATFHNNIHAIYLNACENAKIAHNLINVKSDHNYSPPAGVGFQTKGYGVYLDYCSIFALHDNDIHNLDNTNVESVGIVVKDNGGASDQIQLNKLDRFYYGAQAIGNNRNTLNQNWGLNFICNDFGSQNPNVKDVQVDPLGFIAGTQGLSGGLPNNRFSSGAGSRHFDNFGPSVFYPYGTGDVRVVPVHYLNLQLQSRPVPADFIGECQPLPMPPIVNPSATVTGLANLNTSLQNDINLRQQLLDEGSTPSVEAQILFASSPADYQSLYVDLMDMAPYVSDQSLEKLIALENYPELALRNILIANPHGARNPYLWKMLLEKEPALSQQTLDDIQNGIQTITAKDLLEMQIASKQVSRDWSSKLLLEYYASHIDSMGIDNSDLIKVHLKNRNEVYFRYALIDLYIYEENYEAAQGELDLIPTECALGREEEQAYNWMKQYYSLIINSSGPLDEMSESALISLRDIELNGKGYAVGRARAALILNGQNVGYVEPVLTGLGMKKLASSFSSTMRPDVVKAQFILYPNPATDYAILQWDWLEQGLEGLGEVQLYDVSGHLVKSDPILDLQDNSHLFRWHDLAAGLYLLKLQQAGVTLFQQKLQIE